MLRGFTKGYVVGSGVPSSPDADKAITGGEAGPNPCMVQMWNVVNRTCSSLEESLSQDRPTAWSTKDEGGSEGHPVMGWIRIASQVEVELRSL